eukprot:TRINITY_DN3227_c1_g1_i2.p1 TRINITY_DN3227_c1_g1~~TRINITY_DN3227_c1_g1_i2.p1  ORF type:complete len:989 (-),score=225.86 TRINITY_DN3227_c1_g1_i2:64-3030(-)
MADVAKAYEVAKALAGVWGKLDMRKSPPKLDGDETYEFEFPSASSWICTRTNSGGMRPFKVSYDGDTDSLWWGGSYFLDGNDVRGKSVERVLWYRAGDKAKRAPAFGWKKVQDLPPPSATAFRKAKGKAAAAPSGERPRSSAAAAPRLIPRGQPLPDARSESRGPSGLGGLARRGAAWVPSEGNEKERGGGASFLGGDGALEIGGSSGSGRTVPEVILDLDQLLVVYKPPYWKCELPAKNAGKAEQGNLLPSWLKSKDLGIGESLFEEEFNVAQSGTGFGPLAHRIDVETSGAMLVSKSAAAQRHIKAQFRSLKVSKRYVCLVHGHVAADSGKLDMPIRTMRTDQATRSEISSQGDWAETSYEVVARYSGDNGAADEYSLVACDIKSGRTHQIRVHMLHIGHPLVSDQKYGAEDVVTADRRWCPRLFLHAYRLRFKDVGGDHRVVVCPLPDDLRRAVTSLGAATGEAKDILFGETSWHQEVLRPPLSQWRPAFRVPRVVAALLAAAARPVALKDLNTKFPDLRAAMDDEGVTNIGRAWITRYRDVFEITGGNIAGDDVAEDELCLRLRPGHATGDGSSGDDLERRLEAALSEVEQLDLQKQRAVAEEKYEKAAQIKRRAEAVRAELRALEGMRRRQEEVASDAASDDGDEAAQSRTQQLLSEARAFEEDVQDESLFPALPTRPAPALRHRSLGPATRPGSAAAAASGATRGGTRSVSPGVTASPAAGRLQARAASVDLANGSAAEGGGRVEEEREQVMPLKDALIKFLEVRDNFVAHINEVNNDRGLRAIMAAQRPRVNAITKGWLKGFEGIFGLARAKDGDLYVVLESALKEQEAKAKAKAEAKAARAAAAAAAAAQQPAQPAYRRVVQRTSEAAPVLVYDYSASDRQNAEAEAKSGAAGGAAGKTSSLGLWQEKFQAAIRRSGEESCSPDMLLAAVPSFAEATGARKAQEQRQLLRLFLESSPDIFQVKKLHTGDYAVILRSRASK